MERQHMDELLAQIRAVRAQVLLELNDLTEADFATPTSHARWSDVRRLLLRFGDHMREHANQIKGARQAIGHSPNMPQRMLAEAEGAWGKLLAATVGLTDRDFESAPGDGSWTIRQVLEHVLTSEQGYLAAIRAARQAQTRSG